MDIDVKIKGSRLFKQVASVVGEKEAYDNLLLAMLNLVRNGRSDIGRKLGKSLIEAFNWSNSPQGDEYWRNISRKSRGISS